MSSQFIRRHPMSSAPPSLVEMSGGGGVSLNTFNGLLAPMKNVDETLIALINNNQNLINSNLGLININDTRLDELEPLTTQHSNTLTTHTNKISGLESDTINNTEVINEIQVQKQDVISTGNKLNASLLDTSNSALRFVDINSSLANSIQNINMNIQGVQNQVTAQSNAVSSQSTTLEDIWDTNTLQTNQITELLTSTANISASISNVDNTSDLNKPISTASQNALNLKASVVYVDAQNTALQNQISTNVNGIINLNALISNVNNTSDLNKPISTATQTALNLKASIAYVDSQIGGLANTAPEMLNTLAELANALGDDPNFSTAILNALATKATITYVDEQDIELQDQMTTNTNSISTINTAISNVNNTSDTNKPISTATQSALNLKSSITYVDIHSQIQCNN